MTKANEMAIRALMAADGVPEADIELAVSIAAGGLWVSTPQLCENLKVKRWLVWRFCDEHKVPVRRRSGRCGNLVKARVFFDAWTRVYGGKEG